MALRNAFGELGLESTLRKILAAVTYARSPSDQLRTVVDSGTIAISSGTVAIYNSNSATAQAGQTTSYYASNTWNLVDARENLRESTETHFVMTRNRWSIT